MTTIAVTGAAFTEIPGSAGMPVEVYATGPRDMLYVFSASAPAWTARSTAAVLKTCVRDIELPVGSPVGVGWTYAGGTFTPPPQSPPE